MDYSMQIQRFKNLERIKESFEIYTIRLVHKDLNKNTVQDEIIKFNLKYKNIIENHLNPLARTCYPSMARKALKKRPL